MIVIEIEPNPNCDSVDMRMFHNLEPARRVTHVRLEREPGTVKWYAVTGWTAEGSPCPPLACKVDDSGDGVALLVQGGDAGLRLSVEECPAEWGLERPHQWGEPFLLAADAGDVRWEGKD